MVRKSVCQICGAVFIMKKREETLVNEMIAKGQKFIMIECPECGRGTHFVEPLSPDLPGKAAVKKDFQYRCPSVRCTGWVNHIETSPNEPSFWGCGECGRTWISADALYSDIRIIVDKYSYRHGCYTRKKEKWFPADPEKEDRNYEKLVENEEQ